MDPVIFQKPGVTCAACRNTMNYAEDGSVSCTNADCTEVGKAYSIKFEAKEVAKPEPAPEPEPIPVVDGGTPVEMSANPELPPAEQPPQA